MAAGTNALCEAGLSLAYADVSDEQKLWVMCPAEEEYSCITSFEIEGIPCVAASKPAGMGEERIWVWYTSRLSDLNGGTRAVGSTTPWSPPNLQYEDGSTVTQCILERKMGPYIVKPCSLNKWNFRYTHSNIHALSRMSIQPHEYAINGAPQPYRSQW